MVEGIYLHSGDLAPLADIYRLKEKYKCAPLLHHTLQRPFHLLLPAKANERDVARCGVKKKTPRICHFIFKPV